MSCVVAASSATEGSATASSRAVSAPLTITPAVRDRARGVVLASAVGDALGAGYEFGCAAVDEQGPRMIGGGLGGFAPGEWTDDTTMAWAILDVAAERGEVHSPGALTAIARHFRTWFESDPADIGIHTRQVLGRAGSAPTAAVLQAGADAVHERNGRSGGNGSLMRTGPVALAYLGDPAAASRAAAALSRLTHTDPQAAQASQLWSLAIEYGVRTGELDIRTGMPYLAGAAAGFWEERLREAESHDPGTFRPNGWVVTALQAAWSAITHTPDGSVAKTLATAIRIGDDTDTVAAIAGALIGAVRGASAVPAPWLDIVHGYPGLRAAELTRLVDRVLERGGEQSAS